MGIERVRRDAKPNKSDFFEGSVFSQKLNVNDQFRVNEVAFTTGARTRWHTHAYHQVLVITKGRGIVATEEEELQVGEGDVVHVEPGTKHWHGAGPDSEMTHLAIGPPSGESKL